MDCVQLLNFVFSWRTLMDILSAVCLHTTFLKAEESYYLSESYSSWEEIETSCSAAVPQVKYAAHDVSVEIENVLEIEKNGVWVGYLEILESFEYIGCVNLTSLQNADFIKSHVGTVGKPGHCYSACGYGSIIGVGEKQCLCLDKDRITDPHKLDSRNFQCKTECKNQAGVVCGGSTESGAHLISVYKFSPAIKEISSSGSDDETCLRLEPTSKQFSLFNCSNFQLHLCVFDSVYYMSTVSGDRFYPWIQNANLCLKNGGLPIPFKNYSMVEMNKSAQVWTNVIKSPIIKPINQDGQVAKARVRVGYVVEATGQYLLKFTDNDTTVKRALCHLKETQTQRPTGSDISLVVGVCVAVVIAFGVIFTVIILVILKRRNRIPPCKSIASATTPEPVNDQSQNKTAVPTVSHINHAYDLVQDIDNEDGAENRGYAEQTNDNSTHTYYKLGKHERDYEEAIISSEGEVSKNVYNVVNLENNTIYNTASNTKRTVHQYCDNMYDSTETAIARLQKRSDTTCQGRTDMYSHLDGEKNNNTQIDTTYDKLDPAKEEQN